MLFEMSTMDFLISLAVMCCIAYILGWFCDNILGRTGYGILGNSILVLLGIYGGLYALNEYGYEFHWVPLYTLGAALSGAFVSLFFMCFVKRFTRN